MGKLKEVDEKKSISTSVVNVIPFKVLVMASANNTNAAASCTIFLREGTQAKLPYASVCTGPAGAKIKFGIVSGYVNFLPSPPPSPTEVLIPHLPSKGCRRNVIPPAEVQEDVPAIRTSVFDRLTFPKGVVNINKGEDEEEPSFTITAKGEKSGIFKKPKTTQPNLLQWGAQDWLREKCPPLEMIPQVHLQTSSRH